MMNHLENFAEATPWWVIWLVILAAILIEDILERHGLH